MPMEKEVCFTVLHVTCTTFFLEGEEPPYILEMPIKWVNF